MADDETRSYLTPARRGFVLGKFMPPHEGHVFLCRFAQACCETLTILVCSLEDDPIPGALRYQWMQALFPAANVVWCQEDLPQAPADSADFWSIWKRICLTYGGESPDLVFASEPDGQRLADELDARFVPVDLSRSAFPVSGKAVRSNPFANWAFVPEVVRPYFVKRVCLFGPESTGKSTLSRALALHYGTVIAPEYGRLYTETFGSDCGPEDIRRIVQGHLAGVAAATLQANRILIEDTDPVLTAIWSDLLVGARDPWFESFDQTADLYLLTGIDIPWEGDGIRYFPAEDHRRDFHRRCRNELERRGLPYVEVTGDRDARLATATAAIDSRFFLQEQI